MHSALRELLRIGRCGPVARALSPRIARVHVPGSHLVAFGVLGKPRRGPVDVEVERDDVRWSLDLRDDAQRLMFLDMYESELRHRALARLREGATFVDVGANVGFWSIPAARQLGPRGHVLSFEPNPWAADRFKRNIALNSGAELASIELVDAAIGAEPAELELYSFDLEAGASRATLQRGAVAVSAPAHVTVPVKMLDDVVDFEVDMLKIDVEGHEMAVLDGATRLLSNAPPRLLVIEVQGDLLVHAGITPETLVARIESLGYRAVDGDGLLGRGVVERPLPPDFFETVVFTAPA
jgi:FkbM family methyltransferase